MPGGCAVVRPSLLYYLQDCVISIQGAHPAQKLRITFFAINFVNVICTFCNCVFAIQSMLYQLVNLPLGT